jgi:predicted ATP-binding protein involved in virulence
MTDGNGYDFHLKSFATPEFFLPLFTQPNVSSGPKASVIIGPNGSNKSRVLALIMDELNNVEELRRAVIEQFPNIRRVKSSDFKQGSLFSDEANFSNLDKNKKQMIPSFDAQIEYRMDGFDWIVERHGKRLKVWRNKESFDSLNFSFPDRAIAVAHLPTDRFTFKLNHRDDFYVYLGL